MCVHTHSKHVCYKCGQLLGCNEKFCENRIKNKQCTVKTYYNPGLYTVSDNIFCKNGCGNVEFECKLFKKWCNMSIKNITDIKIFIGSNEEFTDNNGNIQITDTGELIRPKERYDYLTGEYYKQFKPDVSTNNFIDILKWKQY